MRFLFFIVFLEDVRGEEIRGAQGPYMYGITYDVIDRSFILKSLRLSFDPFLARNGSLRNGYDHPIALYI